MRLHRYIYTLFFPLYLLTTLWTSEQPQQLPVSIELSAAETDSIPNLTEQTLDVVELEDIDPSATPIDLSKLPTKSGGVLQPFRCVPNFYQVYGSVGTLVRYNALDIDEGFEEITDLGFPTNAMAYNPIDNFMYATRNADGHIIKIGRGGEWEDLGGIGLPTGLFVGEFSPDGIWYLKKSGATLYEVDVITLTFDAITPNADFRAADWAYNYTDDKLYGVGGTTLYIYDPFFEEVESFPLTGFLGNDSGAFGGAFYTVDGFIYVSNNASGNIYRIDIPAKQVKHVITGPDQLNGNDGAGCPFALPPFPVVYANNDVIRIRKEISKSVTVTNNDSAHFSDVDPSSVEVITDPRHGEYTVSNGRITYTPDEGFGGLDSLEYEVCGNSFILTCDRAKVYIYVAHKVFEAATICEGETYEFYDEIYDETGVYEEIFEDDDEIETIATLELTVLAPIENTITETICQGQSYQFAGEEYDESGSYEELFTNSAGCDSIVVLNLTVNPAPTELVEATICSDETYEYDGETYDEAGTYDIITTNAEGCETEVTLELTVYETEDAEVIAEICAEETYTIEGQTFSTTGVYEIESEDDNGCPNLTILDLTVFEKEIVELIEEICAGETYTIEGQSFSSTGVYELELEDENGCPNETTLDLTVHPKEFVDIVEEICANEIYEIGGREFTSTGIYLLELEDANGCPNQTTLDLTVFEKEVIDVVEEICAGETYELGGRTFSNTGIYLLELEDENGCPNQTTLDLTVVEEEFTDLVEEICAGENYTLDGRTFSTTGVYLLEVESESGCTNQITLDLTVLEKEVLDIVEEICADETYTLGGRTFSNTGIYLLELEDENGCPNQVTLDLTVLEKEVIDLVEEICADETYTIGGRTFSNTGVYLLELEDENGCPNQVTLDLTVFEKERIDLVEEICAGETYELGGRTFSTTGIYLVEEEDENGCLNETTLDLTVHEVETTEIVEEICADETYTIGGRTFSTTGVYLLESTDENGCPNETTLDLTVLEKEVVEITTEICADETYTLGGRSFSVTGIYTLELEDENGCPNETILDLTVLEKEIVEIVEEICAEEIYTIGGRDFTTTGVYNLELEDENGCLNQTTLDLTVFPKETIEVVEKICFDETYTLEGRTFSDTGIYLIEGEDENGCPNQITLDLTVFAEEAVDIVEEICADETYTINGRTFSTTGIYLIEGEDENGCTKQTTLDLTVLEKETIELVEEICTGETYTTNGRTFSATGVYLMEGEDENGCPNQTTLDLTVLEKETSEVVEEICAGETYVVEGRSFSSTGIYLIEGTDENGCPNQTTLDLTVFEKEIIEIVEEICADETYPLGGRTFSETGVYVLELEDENGCPNQTTLDLTVLEQATTEIVEEICAGETYTLNGRTFSNTGIYLLEVDDENGCPSQTTLDLTVHAATATDLVEEICSGETYSLGRRTFSETGIYIVEAMDENGCPSQTTLDLTVLAKETIELVEEICADESYTVGERVFTETGVYLVEAMDENGCPNQITLDLTVFEKEVIDLVDVICAEEIYILGGREFTTTGVYQLALEDENGCLNQTTLDLTVIEPVSETVRESICAGEELAFNGDVYSESGTYIYETTAASGCDSTVILELAVLRQAETSINATICEDESYQFNGENYSESGTYENTLVAANGCDSIVTLDLLVVETNEVAITAAICEGSAYRFGNRTLTEAGSYTQTTTNQEGCDSIVNLELAVLAEAQTFLQEEICAGETYIFNGQNLTNSGTYEQVITTENCDSLITLDLTVLTNQIATIQESVCIGESYTLNGETYEQPGTYQQLLIATNGCDSTLTLQLEHLEILSTTLEQTVCFGESYAITDQDYETSGQYTETLTAINGCDSIVTLNLTVLEQRQTALTETICAEENYQIGTEVFTATGEYEVNLVGSNGCDSMINLTLQVIDPVNTQLNEIICAGESYQIGNQTLTAAGEYTLDFQTVQYGCDSIVLLQLTVIDDEEVEQNITICVGESYTIGDSEYTETGRYTDTFTTDQGCNSVVTTNLIVNAHSTNNLYDEICSDETYTFGNRTLETAGNYTRTLTAANGCDSIIALELVVLADEYETLEIALCEEEKYYLDEEEYTAGSYTIQQAATNGCTKYLTLNITQLENAAHLIAASVCEDELYTLNGTSYNATGTYEQIIAATNGCDSIITLDLTVLGEEAIARSETICVGERLTIGDETFSNAGNYTVIEQTELGCDRIIDLQLTVLESVEYQETAQICAGDSYTFGGEEYTTAGGFSTVLTGSNGCDSVATLVLQVLPNSIHEVDATICAGERYTVGSNSYNSSGSYEQFLIANNGCDSTILLNLEVLTAVETSIDATLCAGESYEMGGTVYNATGTFTTQLTGQNGCDSIVSLQLNVLPVYTENINKIICSNETFDFGGRTLNSTGEYNHTFATTTGCDSTVTLNLQVIADDAQVIEQTICEGDEFTVGEAIYTETGTYINEITTESGCTAQITTYLTVAAATNQDIQQMICAGDSYTLGFSTYTESGNYNAVLTNAAGCDSIVNLNLTVAETVETQLNESICAGSVYQLGDENYTATGSYETRFITSNGCDSIVYLQLQVLPPAETELSASICNGESYSLGTENYSAAGNYTQVLQTASGCDSIVRLQLAIEPTRTVNLTETICHSEVYLLNGETYTESGNYTQRIENSTGCDSIIQLALTVRPVAEITLEPTICEGDSYVVGDETYTAAGQYDILLSSATTNGCDSIVHLNLQVAEPSTHEIAASVCNGESYLVGNDSYTEAGVYTQTLANQAGCDSTVVLTLSILENPQPELAALTTLCADEGVNLFPGTFVEYLWSDGSTNSELLASTVGIYSVTVTNADGCQRTATTTVEMIELTSPDLLSATTPTGCATNDGTITITTENSDNIIYSINGGNSWQTEPLFTELGNGNYQIAVASGDTACQLMAVDTVRLASPEALIIEEINAQIPENCDRNDGQITITASGSMDGYLYSLDNGVTWQSSEVFNNLTAADYEFLVSRPDTTCVTTYPSSITLEAVPSLTLSAEIVAPECEADETGVVSLSMTGGFPPYEYTWSNGATTADLSNIGVGDYTLLATDSSGCVAELAATVTATDDFAVQLASELTGTICAGQSNSLFVNNADELMYQWFNNDSFLADSDSLLVTTAGTYRVEAVNENGCMAIDSLEVNFSETEVVADFLMSAEGLMNEPVVAIEVSWPIPDSIVWEYDQATAITNRTEKNQEIITFTEAGLHEVTLYVYSADCVAKVTRTINIVDDPSKLVNPQIPRPEFTEILEFLLYPNPSDGEFNVRVALSNRSPIKLMIFHEQGLLVDERQLDEQYLYLEDYQLPNLVPGVYAIVLRTATEWRYSTFVVK